MNAAHPPVRVSALSGWTDCPRRGAARSFRVILDAMGWQFRTVPRTVAASVGTGVHAGAMHALRAKLNQTETRPTPAEIVEVAIEAYHAETANGVEFDATSKTDDEAEKQIGAMAEAYHAAVLPQVKPVSVEKRMQAETSGGASLSGQPDVIEAGAIRDLKTGRSADKYHAQLGGYSLLAKAVGEASPEEAVIDWVPRTPVRHPQAPPIAVRYAMGLCEQDARAVLTDIVTRWRRFQATQRPDVFPVNTLSLMCSPKYCVAYGTDWCPISQTFTA